MKNTEAPESTVELQTKISEAWNHLSECLVGMPISDPRWKPAAEWLSKNRQYQAPIGRLPTMSMNDR
jgi:hypothetical protein